MPPEIPILAQSDSKAKFLERLGLSNDSPEGKHIYAMMKEEAINGRARIGADPRSLLPHLINDPTVQPPYSNTQISESAMHGETLYIYRHARPETRVYYRRGHYIEAGMEENWIIKWLLWHVFRYRDSRNRGRIGSSWVAQSPAPIAPDARAGMAAEAFNVHGDAQGLPPMTATPSGSGYGNQSYLSLYRTTSSTTSTPLEETSTSKMQQPAEAAAFLATVTDLLKTDVSPEQQHAQPVRSQSQGYWDPVREAHRENNR